MTHFRVLDIVGVTLTQSDGTTTVAAGDWVTAADGASGLKFTPLPNSPPIQSVTVASAVTDSVDGTGTATSTIDLNPTPGSVEFSLGSVQYQASEGDLITVTGSSVAAAVVDIVKTGTAGGQNSVDIELLPGTALRDDGNLGNGQEDYREPGAATISFTASEAERGIYLELIDDAVAEGAESFTVRLKNPTNGAVLGPITEATVVIIDDDATVPELGQLTPSPAPATTGSLRVTLAFPGVPPEAGRGGWRLDGGGWMADGATVSGLEPGDHEIEFLPVVGFERLEDVRVSITAGEHVEFVGRHLPDPAVTAGSLRVDIAGAPGAWRLVGEGADDWTMSGVTRDDLPAGVCAIEFQALAGYDRPLARELLIIPGSPLVIAASYQAEAAFGRGAAAIAGAPLQSSPYQWLGQLVTPLGEHTGTAVSEHVVLTSASALFDEHNYRYAGRVRWHHGRDGDARQGGTQEKTLRKRPVAGAGHRAAVRARPGE